MIQTTAWPKASGPFTRDDARPIILFVDDEPPVLAALRRLFRSEPYEVMTTGSPDVAMEWIDSRDVSMVVADQRMPAMSGTQLLKLIGSRSPTTMLVMLTAYPDPEVFGECLKIGTRRLITKPWDDRHFKRTVGELLRELEQDRDEPEEVS